MGIFDKYKKKDSNTALSSKENAEYDNVERKSVFDCGYDIDKGNWFQVFSACLGKMMVIQNACSELVVKNRDWNVDFSQGIISFGNDEYPLQFIGSESSSSNTWLWGWENINSFDEKFLKVANFTKQTGENWSLEPLSTAEFDLTDTFNGHNLSIVTCGISHENLCYYKGPHSGGAIFVAFSNVQKEVFNPVDITKFTNITMQCINQFVVDHKIFIESFLIWNGTKYEWKQNSIVAYFEQDLHIEFEQADEFYRISSMKTI